MIETILCAAIWYKELELKKTFEHNVLPVNCDVGLVFCGHRHPQCMYTMCSITGLRSVTPECGEYVQGDPGEKQDDPGCVRNSVGFCRGPVARCVDRGSSAPRYCDDRRVSCGKTHSWRARDGHRRRRFDRLGTLPPDRPVPSQGIDLTRTRREFNF